MRSSVTNAIQHVRTFTTEVTEASKKLASVIEFIEGMSNVNDLSGYLDI